MSLLKYQNKRRNDNGITVALSEYEEIIALIEKKYNDGVALLYKDMESRLSSLRVQHDEQLISAWNNFMTIITPYLKENQRRILAETGAYPAPEDARELDGEIEGAIEVKDLMASSST